QLLDFPRLEAGRGSANAVESRRQHRQEEVSGGIAGGDTARSRGGVGVRDLGFGDRRGGLGIEQLAQRQPLGRCACLDARGGDGNTGRPKDILPVVNWFESLSVAGRMLDVGFWMLANSLPVHVVLTTVQHLTSNIRPQRGPTR